MATSAVKRVPSWLMEFYSTGFIVPVRDMHSQSCEENANTKKTQTHARLNQHAVSVVVLQCITGLTWLGKK